MPNHCKVCFHDKRTEIERDILSGRMTNSEASRIVGCSETSIRRHFKNHVSKALQQMKMEHPKSGVMDAYNILNDTISDCKEIMSAAKTCKDWALQLKAMSQMIDNLTLAAKLFELNKKDEENKLIIEVLYHDVDQV